MKLVGFMSTAVLSLTLAAAAPMYAQEQHDQQEEQKDKPAQEKEKQTKPPKPAKQEEKKAPQQDKNAQQHEKASQQQNNNTKNEEKNAQQHTQQAKPQQQAQNHNGGGRIPDDRYRAHFGQEHRFRVNQGDYRNHRFQYGGYSFGFVDAWPSNWLYTQDVFVVDIDGVYYLCNPMYPGVNVALSVTL